MIYDFSRICKTYDKNIYTKNSFAGTSCPKCYALGRFNLHGSYSRHVIYFEEKQLVHRLIEIKRIKCKSCDTTHAVLPGDIIAYKLLSLFVVLSILFNFYLKKIPVLEIAAKLDFSFQFIYSCLHTFVRHVNAIHQYFRQMCPNETPTSVELLGVLVMIRSPYRVFQCNFIRLNGRPCFMCKFHKSATGPPIGILTVHMPSKG